jgi:hypothetical protein
MQTGATICRPTAAFSMPGPAQVPCGNGRPRRLMVPAQGRRFAPAGTRSGQDTMWSS